MKPKPNQLVKNTNGTEAVIPGMGFCIVKPDGEAWPIPHHMSLNDARELHGYKPWAVGKYGENLWRLEQ